MGSGLIFSSFGYAPVLGYIITGIALGPSGFKMIADRAAANILSELGIMLLLFVIGLELSFDKIRNIWKNSIGITLTSLLFTLGLCGCAGALFKLSFSQILLIAFCISISSTAVTVKSFRQLPNLGENIESNTFGILIVQDVVALLMVLILNMFGREGFNQQAVYKCCAIGAFVFGVIFYFGRYHKHIYKLTNFLRKHSDMLAIIIFGLCLGGAVLAEFAGLSAAFGAFIIGLILGNSNFALDAKSIALPIEELLLMTFFLGVGLMVDLDFIWLNFGLICLALLFVMFGKTFINLITLRLFKFDLRSSFIISVLLGHIGEFSFMLVYTGLRQGIVDAYGMHFLVSVTALSLFLSPFWVKFAERCRTIASTVVDVSAWEFFKLATKSEIGKGRRLWTFVLMIFKNSFMLAYNKSKMLKKKTQEQDGGIKQLEGTIVEATSDGIEQNEQEKNKH